MKFKYFVFSILLSLLPTGVLAYSDYIIPGGQSVGIDINTDGIMVVGFYKVDGKFNKGNPSLMVGDRIIKVGDVKIDTVNDLIENIEKQIDNGRVAITFLRNEKAMTTDLALIYEGDNYKTGLYVKDSITGIGTITYIDPTSKIYGALGHEIVESNSNLLVEVKKGNIFKSVITGIDRSVSGTPGGKNAKFYSGITYGTIDKNTVKGIYGKYNSNMPQNEALPIAQIDEVEKGKAYIYTVLNGEEVGKYEIEITKVDEKNAIKNIYFEVTDRELLEKTGGIVQGMSGSPIIQNDKIIGAVTHVVVSNPSSGYGISIVKMLEEGER